MSRTALTDADVELLLTRADVADRPELADLDRALSDLLREQAGGPVTPNAALASFLVAGALPVGPPSSSRRLLTRFASMGLGLKLALGATAAAAALAGAGAAGVLPEPLQRIVDRVVVRDAGPEDPEGPDSLERRDRSERPVRAPVIVREEPAAGRPDAGERRADRAGNAEGRGAAAGPAGGGPGPTGDPGTSAAQTDGSTTYGPKPPTSGPGGRPPAHEDDEDEDETEDETEDDAEDDEEDPEEPEDAEDGPSRDRGDGEEREDTD